MKKYISYIPFVFLAALIILSVGVNVIGLSNEHGLKAPFMNEEKTALERELEQSNKEIRKAMEEAEELERHLPEPTNEGID